MKKKSFTLLLILLLSMVGTEVRADDYDIFDGILYYNIHVKNKVAEVIKKPDGKYSGVISIPSYVDYWGDVFGRNAGEYKVVSIGGSAFYECYDLTSITIPNTVTSIQDRAFQYCSGLTSITIPNKVESIGLFAFYGCTGLTSVTLKSNFIVSNSKMRNVFGNQVKKYIIGNDVKKIGAEAFLNCSELTSITIPNSVTSIGSSALRGCTGLTSITIPNSVTSIGESAFAYCSGLTSVTIPNSVTSIDGSTFEGCTGLTSITIPNSVTDIGSYAFSGCSGLTSITIPSSVTNIGQSAFTSCSGLTSVTVLNPTPVSISDNVFSNRANATLYVPQGSKSAYQATKYWKEFKEIIEIDPSGIDQIMNNENGKAIIFTLDGKRVTTPQRGVNVIRMKDGTTRKVVVK